MSISEVTDLELAQLACIDIYAEPCPLELQTISGVAFAIVQVGDHTVVVFRGSKTPGDWLRDLDAEAIKVEGLGHVHKGFYTGLPDVLVAVLPKLGQSIYVCGHSLGGGEAPIFSLMLVRSGLAPRACVMFAPPRPGFEDFRDSLDLTGIELRGYQNAGDPVPHVPEPILPFFPWAHVCPLTQIAVPTAEGDNEPLRAHHGVLYFEGAKQLTLG